MVRLLDCTLRDGGYYTNWKFKDSFLISYFKCILNLGIEDIEIGYVNPGKQDSLYCLTPSRVRELLLRAENAKIWVMFDYKHHESFSDIEKILDQLYDAIYGVRITLPISYNDKVIQNLVTTIKKKNLKVSINIMQCHRFIDGESLNLEFSTELDQGDCIAIVDSFGVLVPSDLSKLVDQIRNDNGSIMIGFHGHNNMELAFANALQAIELDVSIIDCTLQGFGRGAGNLRTELIAPYLNNMNGCLENDILYRAVCEVPKIMKELSEKYDWGAKPHYILGALNGLPQSDIMRFINADKLDPLTAFNKALSKEKFH